MFHSDVLRRAARSIYLNPAQFMMENKLAYQAALWVE